MDLLVGYFCLLLSKDHNASLPPVDVVCAPPVGKLAFERVP